MGIYPFMHACCHVTNTFLGAEAGSFAMTGTGNTGLGVDALLANTAGSHNTATGAGALQINTEGWLNTAMGSQALQLNTDGSSNTAVGYQALYYNCEGVSSGCAADNNTAVGYQAGYTATAANANKTGSNNTFIGYNSGPGTSTQLTNATAIGANALVSQSDSLVLGASGVNVGIGTDTPGASLDVHSGDILVGPILPANLPYPYVYGVWVFNDPGDAKNTFRLDAFGNDLAIAGFSGTGSAAGTSLSFRTGTAGGGELDRMRIAADGKVGIGTTGPTHPLHMGDGAYEDGGTNASDRSAKENFRSVSGTDLLTQLARVPITTWNYKAQGQGVRHLGPVAQDFYAAFHLGADDKHITTVDEGGVALAAIQALYRMDREKDEQIRRLARSSAEKDAQIRRLTRQVQELQKVERQMATLEARLPRLENGRASEQTASAKGATRSRKSLSGPTLAKVRF